MCGLESLADRRQRLRIRRVRHRVLVLGALLEHVERRRQVEDRLAVLDRDDAARREAAAVTDAVDVVDDRHARVAGSQEVRVERVHEPVLDRATRGDQRLPGDLAAEHALAVLVRAEPAEQIDLELLQLQQFDQLVERSSHEAADPRGAPGQPLPVRRDCSAEEDGGGVVELLVDGLELLDAGFDRDADDVGAAAARP